MSEMPFNPRPEPIPEETLQHGLQEFQRHFALTQEELDALIILLNRMDLESIARQPIAVFRHHSTGAGPSILERIEQSLGTPKQPQALRTLYTKLKAAQEKLQ